MTISRRNLVTASMAAGTAVLVPSILRAQTIPSAARTVRMVNGNITNFDPYVATSYSTVDHALAIYDMLFALDSKFAPQPQMVGKWSRSDDKRTYTFELRDGLGFHDGAPVTAADCVASIRRWFQTPGGQLVNERAKDVSKNDDKTFTISLKEPLALLIDQLAQPINYQLFVMREKNADRPPTEPVTAHIGSGPFRFNEALFKPGASVVYDRNERYVPRQEPPNGLAGGKVVKVDRAVWHVIADQQTALAALQAGEIDLHTWPEASLLPMIDSDPNLVVEDLHKSGSDYIVRMNCLQKPFDNVKARQALLHLVHQDAFLRVIDPNPNPKYNRPITSLFGTDTPYVNDVNTGWYKKGGDPEKAKQLFKEAGYAGEKVLILQPTDWLSGSNVSQLLAATLNKIGINAELAPATWAALGPRRAKKDSVENGGWSIFVTTPTDLSFSDPLSSSWMFLNGEKGWYGWPKNDEYEALRAKWVDTETVEERKALARKMQEIWWDTVGFVFIGQNIQPIARRKTLTGLIGVPAFNPMWNMQKV
ncbi:ABC transporter substrate-binding protein [Bradyrhizobium sp. SEMIA]|uniref:ABC transporter substrate-binding protein n=1 Tax=Bradyrhizobium sp. SEMIA TaxID=2597515 RepID=UPI0018A43CDF|nr:ABC transporter substrate-binding protein [Bradyrhizobium sp. SEMIA]QOG21082.1 ABC transporter substrate-binding protein [Bradyrhizobium sp. SEMIA]